MSTHAHPDSRNDSDAPSSPATPPVAVQTTFRHLHSSPAVVDLVTHEAGKLARYFTGIIHCHVVIAAQQKHHPHGQSYSVHVELGVPRGPIVVDHETAGDVRPQSTAPEDRQRSAIHEDLYATIRDAFAIVRRRLEDHVRRLRGEDRSHEPETSPQD